MPAKSKSRQVNPTGDILGVIKWIEWLLVKIAVIIWGIVKFLVQLSGPQQSQRPCKEKSRNPKKESNGRTAESTNESSDIVITSCSYEGCDWSGASEALAAHQETCEWHLVTCKFCGWTGAFCKRKEHKSLCMKCKKTTEAVPTKVAQLQAETKEPEVRSVPGTKVTQMQAKTKELQVRSVPAEKAEQAPPKVKAVSSKAAEAPTPKNPAPKAAEAPTPKNPAPKAAEAPAPKNPAPKAAKKKGGEVSCPYQGCQWVGAESNLGKHSSICNHRIVECDKGCGWRGAFLDLEDHYPKCSYRLMFCPRKCGAVFKAKDLDLHEGTCKKCSNQSHQSSIKPSAQGQQEVIDRETPDNDDEPETNVTQNFQAAGSKKGKAKKQAAVSAVSKPSFKSQVPDVAEAQLDVPSDMNGRGQTEMNAKHGPTIGALCENWPSERVEGSVETPPAVDDSMDVQVNADGSNDFPSLEALAENFPSLSSGVKSAGKKLPGRFSKSNAAAIDIKTGRLKGKQSNVRKSAEDTCPVCLEPLALAKCAVLRRCKHQFHAACVEAAAWCATSAGLLCPCCRTKFVWNDIEFCREEVQPKPQQQTPDSAHKVQYITAPTTITHSDDVEEAADEVPERPPPPPCAPIVTAGVSESALRSRSEPDRSKPVTKMAPMPAVRAPEPKQIVPAKPAQQVNVAVQPANPAQQARAPPEPKQTIPAKAAEATPARSNPWDPRSMPQAKGTRPPPLKKLSRRDKQDNLFKLLDVDGDGRLSSAEMFRFASMTGFPADGDWESEFELFCQECNSRPSTGIEQTMFISLIDDTSDAGCYCDDEEIEEYCRSLAAERDRRLKEAPPPKAKLLTLAEIQKRRQAEGKNSLPQFAGGGSANRIAAPPGLEKEDVEEEQEDSEEESSDDAFW